MPDLATVILSAAVSFGVALGLLWLAHKAGLTDVQERLVAALKDRVQVLEDENTRKDGKIAQLEAEVAALERRYARLERDYERLMARVEQSDARV